VSYLIGFINLLLKTSQSHCCIVLDFKFNLIKSKLQIIQKEREKQKWVEEGQNEKNKITQRLIVLTL